MKELQKGLEKDQLSFSRARIALKLKFFKKAERRFYSLVKVRNGKLRKEAHQFLFDYVDKKRSKFRNFALRVLKTGDEPFRSEAFLRVGKDFLNKKKIGSARSQFFKILKSKQALNESKAKAAVLIAEMDVETLKLTLPSGPMSGSSAMRYIERMMLRAQPNIDQIQAVFKFNDPESSLRALIKLSRLYVDLNIVFESIQVSDKAHSKRSTERGIRALLTKIRDSYYKSYRRALDIMSRNKKLKIKYSSRLRRIKRDFKKFYKTQRIVMRGSR